MLVFARVCSDSADERQGSSAATIFPFRSNQIFGQDTVGVVYDRCGSNQSAGRHGCSGAAAVPFEVLPTAAAAVDAPGKTNVDNSIRFINDRL